MKQEIRFRPHGLSQLSKLEIMDCLLPELPGSGCFTHIGQLSRKSLRSMEAPINNAYYLADKNLEIIHFGPGKMFKGLFAQKVEQASREQFDNNGQVIGITAVFRSPDSTGYQELKDQEGLFSFQTVGGVDESSDTPQYRSDSAKNSPGRDESVRFSLDGANQSTPGFGMNASIIGCVQNVTLQQDLEGLCQAFTNLGLKIVSASMTAAAYDDSNQPGINQDVKTLKKIGGQILNAQTLKQVNLQTNFGVMLLGLMQCYEQGVQSGVKKPAVTLLALENLIENGARLKNKLVNMARELDATDAAPEGFTQSLIDDVNSPNLLIDRIVPSPPSQVICSTDSNIYECHAGVVTEPYGSIVVANDTNNPDTNLTILGEAIQTTNELDKYTGAKAGMLNAVHALSGGMWLQTESTAETLHNFLQAPKVRYFVKGLMTEIGQSLDPIDGFDMSAYRDSILSRFQNDQLVDHMSRLSSQLPRKIKQYIAPVVQRALARDCAIEHMMDALNATLKTIREDDTSQVDLLNTLSGNDPRLRQKLESRLAIAERKAQTVGSRNIFTPIIKIGRSITEDYEDAGLNLDSFTKSPERFPIQLNENTVLLFDNDGTLVNSESIALEAAHGLVTDVLAKHSKENPFTVFEFSQRFAGKNFSIILSELNEELLNGKLVWSDIEQYSAEEEHRCEQALAGRVTATPHTLETLQWVPSSQKAVVTSASHARCDASLNTLNIKDQFDGKIFSALDSLPQPKPKPDPAIYQHAIEKLGLQAGESQQQKKIVVVEDSGSGVTSARRAGADYVVGFVGADNLQSTGEQESRAEKLRMAGATDIIDNMAFLPLVLAKRGLAQHAD